MKIKKDTIDIFYWIFLIILIIVAMVQRKNEKKTIEDSYKLIYNEAYTQGFVDGINDDRKGLIDSTLTDSMVYNKAKFRYWELLENGK